MSKSKLTLAWAAFDENNEKIDRANTVSKHLEKARVEMSNIALERILEGADVTGLICKINIISSIKSGYDTEAHSYYARGKEIAQKIRDLDKLAQQRQEKRQAKLAANSTDKNAKKSTSHR